MRTGAAMFLLLVAATCLGAGWLAPHSYQQQFRDSPNAAPSARFPLGTDELGRDRFSRLLYGTQVSLLMAPAAALLSTALAALIGLAAGWMGGWWDRTATMFTDLFLSLPWLFLLLTLRAVLPLNVPAAASVSITFLLLGLLGWAHGARVVRASVAMLKDADFTLQARANGCHPARLLLVHLAPNLRPVLTAQFWIAIPSYILAEANLGILGLGVAEPLPSWGNLLSELVNYRALGSAPWLLAPCALLAAVLGALHIVFQQRETIQ